MLAVCLLAATPRFLNYDGADFGWLATLTVLAPIPVAHLANIGMLRSRLHEHANIAAVAIVSSGIVASACALVVAADSLALISTTVMAGLVIAVGIVSRCTLYRAESGRNVQASHSKST